jgi:hypothetical protein
VVAGGLVLAPMAFPVYAQVIERPPRSTAGFFGGGRPLHPNVTQTETTLSLSLLGGWEDNVAPPGRDVPVGRSGTEQSGFTGAATGLLNFRRGRASRSFETRGRVFVNAYRNLGVDPLIGGELAVQGSSSLGRNTDISARGSARYVPTFALGSFDAIANQVDSGLVQDLNPSSGALLMRSRNLDFSLDLRRHWSVRHRTTAGYTQSKEDHLEGTSLNSRHQTAMLGHSWDFSRPAGISVSYRYSNQKIEEAIGERPLQSNDVEVGMNLRKVLSRTRRVLVTAGSGLTHTRSVSAVNRLEFDYVVPLYFGSVRLDVGRTWAVSGDYRRTVSMLEGVSLQVFVTDAASLTIGGNVGRLLISASGAYSNGDGRENERGSYESMAGTLQVQYPVSRCCSFVTSYNYYTHRVKDLLAISPGFPSRFDRNSIRFGMSIGLPLYGTFAPAGSSAAGRQ